MPTPPTSNSTMKMTADQRRQELATCTYIEVVVEEGFAQWTIGPMRGDRTVPYELTGRLNGKSIFFGAFVPHFKEQQNTASALAVSMGLIVHYLPERTR